MQRGGRAVEPAVVDDGEEVFQLSGVHACLGLLSDLYPVPVSGLGVLNV
jgi:hypothetical protein